MGTLQLDRSDIISIVALIVSILFGIGNLIYTRRTFIASIYPLVQTALHVRLHEKPIMYQYEGVHELYISLRNLSDKVRLTNITTIVEIKNYAKGWKFWQQSWLPFTFGRGDIVEPGSDKNISTKNVIEVLLTEKMPEIIRRVEIPQPYGEGTRNITYYTPIDSRSLRLKVTVHYTPAISGAKKRTIKSQYKLLPNPQTPSGNLPYPLYDWQITEGS